MKKLIAVAMALCMLVGAVCLMASCEKTDENTLVMHGRWVETCIQDTYVLKFDGDSLSVEPDNNSAFRFFKPEPIVIEKL